MDSNTKMRSSSAGGHIAANAAARRRRRRPWRGLVSVAVASLLLGACGGSDPNAAGTETDNSTTPAADPTTANGGETDATVDEEVPETVRLGVGGAFSFTYLPTYVALAEGFFEDELSAIGASVEVEGFGGSVDATNALVNGDVHYISSVSSTMLNSIAAGADLQQVMQFYTTDIVMLIAREGVPTEPSELAGTSWGITSFGANNHVSALNVAEHFGLSEDEIELVAVGPPTAYEAAIDSAQIDLVFAGQPAAENLIIDGRANLVLDLFDPDNVEDVYGGPYATSGVQGQPSFVEDHPATTEAIVRAHVRALEFIQENLDNPERIAEGLPDEMQSDNIVAILERITAGLSEDGMVLREGLERVIDAGLEAGLLEDPDFDFDLDTIVENSYL